MAHLVDLMQRSCAAARRATAGGCACQPSLRLRAAYSTPRTVRNSWPLRVDARAGYGPSGGGGFGMISHGAQRVVCAVVTKGDCALGTLGGGEQSSFAFVL